MDVKRIVLVLSILVLLFLSLAAMNDINSGLENDYSLEYSMLMLATSAFGAMIGAYFGSRASRKK